MATSYYVKDGWMGTQRGFTLNGIVLLQYLPYLRMRIIQISKDHSLALAASFNTGGKFSYTNSFGAKVAFFNHTAHAGRKLFIGFFDKRSWITPVETSHAVGASCHTESTANTPVKVHNDQTIFILESSFSRTSPYTRRIITMVTEYWNLVILGGFVLV